MDVLITSCRPHQTSDYDYSEHESLFYPPNLPLTTSLEIANLPILDGIRNVLFPLLPQGHYLTVARDKLEVVIKGSRMGPQPLTLRNDGRVATIAVTLPSRFHGGKFIIRDAEGHEEEYFGRNGKDGDLEWVAFTADCDYQVETVTKGCRLTVFYGVYLKTFGPTGLTEPLINPSDKFLELLSRVLNSNSGQRIGIYLTNAYGVNPSEVLAETLVPMVRIFAFTFEFVICPTHLLSLNSSKVVTMLYTMLSSYTMLSPSYIGRREGTSGPLTAQSRLRSRAQTEVPIRA